MALGIVKYAYDCSSQLIGVIWFEVSLFAVSLSWSVVMDPNAEVYLLYPINGELLNAFRTFVLRISLSQLDTIAKLSDYKQ